MYRSGSSRGHRGRAGEVRVEVGNSWGRGQNLTLRAGHSTTFDPNKGLDPNDPLRLTERQMPEALKGGSVQLAGGTSAAGAGGDVELSPGSGRQGSGEVRILDGNGRPRVLVNDTVTSVGGSDLLFE